MTVANVFTEKTPFYGHVCVFENYVSDKVKHHKFKYNCKCNEKYLEAVFSDLLETVHAFVAWHPVFSPCLLYTSRCV